MQSPTTNFRRVWTKNLLNHRDVASLFKVQTYQDTKGPFTRQKRRNGSGRNEYRFQQNLTVYSRKFCKGTDKQKARSSENRGTDKDRLHVVFFETRTDRARDMKLQRLVRMHLRPYLKRL